MLDYQGEKFKQFLKIRIDTDKKNKVADPLTMGKAQLMMNASKSTFYQYFKSESLSRETVKRILSIFEVSENDIWGNSHTDRPRPSENDYNQSQKNSEIVNEEPPLYRKKGNIRPLGEIHYPLEVGETPFIDLGEGKYIMVVPLVNEYAYAGYLPGYSDPEYIEELPKHTIIVDKHHKGRYMAFEVIGDSMDNDSRESIVDGSIATGREIQQHLWTSKFHTHRFKDYIIVHKKHGIIAKRITHHDTDTGIITCHSLNPDKDKYPDYDIHLDDVKQMFNVVNVLQKR